MSILEFINYTKAHPLNFINYCEVLIDQYGAIIICKPSHPETALQYVATYCNKTRQQIIDEIPNDCLPLDWCVDRYGLIAVWHNGYICSSYKNGPNRFQKRAIKLLLKNNLIKEDFIERANEYVLYLKRKSMGIEDLKCTKEMTINLLQSKCMLFDMRWHCDEITGIIDEYYNMHKCDHFSYIQVYDNSDNFTINTENHFIKFSIRIPGCTIGHFKCNAFGTILEIKLYNFHDNYNLNDKFKKLIGEKINIVELAKIEFVNKNIKINSKANNDILWFIANFLYYQPKDYNVSSEIIHNQFRAGYCLHFAMMLKNLFKSGEICWAAPYGHIVYMHDGIPYDIEGINTSDCDYYIPISYIKDGIKDFTRIPSDYFDASQEYINCAIKKYKQDNSIE